MAAHGRPSIAISRFLLVLAAGLGLSFNAIAQHPSHAHKASRPAPPRLTLEQAVQRVQNQTGGKVLKADSRNTGRVVEYRIKVLTPDGHVRVITMRSDQRNADTN